MCFGFYWLDKILSYYTLIQSQYWNINLKDFHALLAHSSGKHHHNVFFTKACKGFIKLTLKEESFLKLILLAASLTNISWKQPSQWWPPITVDNSIDWEVGMVSSGAHTFTKINSCIYFNMVVMEMYFKLRGLFNWIVRW